METPTLPHVLSLTTCSEILGMTRSGTYKKLQKANFSMEKNEQQEIEINSSVFAGKYPEETAAYLRRLSGHDKGNDNGNNGKQQELEVKDKEIDGLKAEVFQLNQRLIENEQKNAANLASKDEVIQTLRLLTDQSVKAAGQVPQEAIEKIARLEAENVLTAKAVAKAEDDARALARQLQEVQEVARRGVDIAPEELAELRRKAKIIDDNKAAQEILTQLRAQYDALPFFKRMVARVPTLEMAKVALKEKQSTNQQTSEPPAAKAG